MGRRRLRRSVVVLLGAALLVVLLAVSGAIGLAGVWASAGLALAAGGLAAYPAEEGEPEEGPTVEPAGPIMEPRAAAAPVPPPPAAVTGRLIDVGGHPVRQAALVLLDGEGAEAGRTTTAADGGFSLGPVHPGGYRLLCMADPFPPSVTAVDVGPAGAETLVVLRGRGGLRGVALDGAGATIAGLEVSVRRPGGTGALMVTTDSSGHFLLEELDDGEWEVQSGPGGHEPLVVTATVVAGATEYVRMSHRALASLRGTVVSPGPQVGAEVILLRQDGTVVARTRTDRSGAYRLEGLRAGGYVVVAGLLVPLAAPLTIAGGEAAEVTLVG